MLDDLETGKAVVEHPNLVAVAVRVEKALLLVDLGTPGRTLVACPILSAAVVRTEKV